MQGKILSNRYLVGDEIGVGGMGSVYRATDLRTGGTVAVKVPHAFLAQNPEYLARLRREAEIAAVLASPRVVRVIDLDSHQGLPFLVMEYVPGETLADVLRVRGRLSLPEALAVAGEVARALDAAHERDIVHRDLKPQNIKVSNGEVKVLDFGIAKGERFSGLTAASTFLGTPEYSAPERADGLGDIRSDIYSLGIMLFQMIAGYLPFQALNPLAVIKKQESEPPPALGAEVPEAVRAIVYRCLAKPPADRYQTPRELVQALSAAQVALAPDSKTMSPSVALTKPLPVRAAKPSAREAELTQPLKSPLAAWSPNVPDPPPSSLPPTLALPLPPRTGEPEVQPTVPVSRPAPGPATIPHRVVRTHASTPDGPATVQTPVESSPALSAAPPVQALPVRPPRAAPDDQPKRSSRAPWLAGGAVTVALLAAGVFLYVRNTGNGADPAATARAGLATTAVPARAPSPVGTPAGTGAAGSGATATPGAPPDATPAATQPPAPPGINLAALATEDERAVGRAVNEANVAVVRALRTGGRAALVPLFTGEALERYGAFAESLRSNGRYAVTELLNLELTRLRLLDAGRAEVRTRERWTYAEFTLSGERVPESGQETLESEVYTLVKQGDRWLVELLEITNISTTPR